MLTIGEGTKREECLLKVTEDPRDPPATAGQQNVMFIHLDNDTSVKKKKKTVGVKSLFKIFFTFFFFTQGTQEEEQITLQICKEESKVSITKKVKSSMLFAGYLEKDTA